MIPPKSILICWVLSLLALAGPVAAFAPSSITSLASKTSLDDAQKQKISDYATYYVNQLETGNAEEVMQARAKLIEPMTNLIGSISSTFRGTYTNDVLPALSRIIEGDENYRGINALQVIGFLGSDSAIRVLVEHSDQAEEPSVEKRLWAAIAIREAIRRSELSPRKIKSAARDLKRAVETETDWRVLTGQFETISSIAQTDMSDDEGGADLRAFGRDMQIEVIEEVVNRLQSKSTPIGLIHSLQPGIATVRQQYLDGSRTLREEIGLGLAPPLQAVYVIVVERFDELNESSPDVQQAAWFALQISEETLKSIDASMRKGDTAATMQSETAWKNGQRDVIKQHGEVGAGILSGPPYSNTP